jgi:hypothetical protein
VQKVVTWAAQLGIAGALPVVASRMSGHGLSPLLAGMAGGVALAGGIGLGIRAPRNARRQAPCVARAQRDDGRMSTSTFDG